MSGFKKTGICPFNRAAIDDSKFMPAEARKAVRDTDGPPPPPDPDKLHKRFAEFKTPRKVGEERKAVIVTGAPYLAKYLAKKEEEAAAEAAKKEKAAARKKSREDAAADRLLSQGRASSASEQRGTSTPTPTQTMKMHHLPARARAMAAKTTQATPTTILKAELGR